MSKRKPAYVSPRAVALRDIQEEEKLARGMRKALTVVLNREIVTSASKLPTEKVKLLKKNYERKKYSRVKLDFSFIPVVTIS